MYFARIFYPLFYKNTIHYVLNSQKCINIIMARWCEQVNNLSFGNLWWQDTHAKFPKFSSLPFTVRQKGHYSGVSNQIFNFKLQPTRCNVSWFIYFYRRSTCCRRFLCPSSSGAHNCTYSFRYCQWILLLAAIVDEMKSRNVASCWL